MPMEFSRQEYWNGVPFPSPGDLHYSEIKSSSLMSPALVDRFFTTTVIFFSVFVLFIADCLFISSRSLLNIFLPSQSVPSFYLSVPPLYLQDFGSSLLLLLWILFQDGKTAYFFFICLVFRAFTTVLHLLHVSLSFHFVYFLIFEVSFLLAERP